MTKSKTMKFATAAEAREHGTALHTAGAVHAWCDYKSGSEFVLRVIRRSGGKWEYLRA